MLLSDDAFRAPGAGLLASMLLIGMVATLVGAGEARAQGMPSNMKDMPGMGAAKQATTAAGSGTVTAVSIPNTESDARSWSDTRHRVAGHEDGIPRRASRGPFQGEVG
jgi:hypothetical protein